MGRLVRVIEVTAGLSATGAAVGALCGAAAVSLMVPFRTGPGALLTLAVAAAVGTVIGAVAAPLAGWGLLRRVPLGRAIGYGALGTVLGALAGSWGGPVGAFAGALVGFGAASARLAVRARREAARRQLAERAALKFSGEHRWI